MFPPVTLVIEGTAGGAADSFVMQHDVPSILAGHYDPSFRLALCLKDLALVDDLLTDTGVRHEITAATYDRFREAASRYGDGAGEMGELFLALDWSKTPLGEPASWSPASPRCGTSAASIGSGSIAGRRPTSMPPTMDWSWRSCRSPTRL